MPNKSSALGQRTLWILTSYQHNQIEPLTLDPTGDGGFLPVFSFKEEAQAFLVLLGEEGKERGWRSTETSPRELISVLLAPCAKVKQVALDPLPSHAVKRFCLFQRKPVPLRQGFDGRT